MVSARRKDMTVRQTVKGIQLDLTPAEADALVSVLYLVGGRADETRRGLVQPITNLLENMGATPDTSDIVNALQHQSPVGLKFLPQD